MMRDIREKIVRHSGKFMLYIIPVCILLLNTSMIFGSVVRNSLSTVNSNMVLSEALSHLLLTVAGAIVIVFSTIIYFSLKLRKINKELVLKNKEIVKINNDLIKSNSDLAEQKDLVMKQYSETDKFYRILFQSAEDGIAFYDSELNLKYANSAFYSVIGYNRETYKETDPRSIIHPDERDYRERFLAGLKNNGFYECELRLRHREGHYVILSTKSVQVKDDAGNLLGALTISRDITRLKKINEDLVKASLEAETSSRLKSSFLANISHEIRTPLNSVVGFSNLLLANDITQEVKEEYIEQINHNSEKLLQIIGDIIDLSRLESSQIEITYEETSVNEVVNEVIEESRQTIRRSEKSIILNVRNQFSEDSDMIFTDKIWLRRVLNHLMDNATKFTLDGSIDLSYYKENENLVFRIKDTGIGINKENLVRIFEEFRQEIDGHHRPFEGLGIGLTLAKEVIERMGGTIYVESEKGIGSEFSFAIPFRPAGSTKTKLKAVLKDQQSGQFDWSSKKCLLVDDNKDVLVYLNRTLLDTGLQILTARSGREAIDIISSTPDIDVVLLDMQMPEMNGIEATKEIRKLRKTLPIIAQTAFIFEDDKDIILEAGCDACLIKPIRKEHLLTVLASFIKSN
jgi:PAS domain S-box-containing protein